MHCWLRKGLFFEKLPIAYMHQPTPVVSSALCLCVPSIRSTSSTDEKTRHYLRQRSDESDGQTKETEIREAQAAFLHPTRCAWVCSAGCAPSPRDSQRISCREHTFLFFSHNIQRNASQTKIVTNFVNVSLAVNVIIKASTKKEKHNLRR